MAILLTAKELTKGFTARPLFEGVSFVVEEGEHVGLIGPNGAGKSTLLKLLAGKMATDSGEISARKGLRVGFLEQSPVLPEESTVEEAVLSVASESAGRVMSKLELNPLAHSRVGTLSGGWKKRVALARELVREPDLLLLDEPTNHLDIESIIWLERLLSDASFATVIITHDRLFLQRVTNRILELDRRNPGGLLNVRGNYITYLKQKEELLNAQKREETVLRNTLRRETEWLSRGPKARTTKQKARIQAAEELQSAVSELEYRNQSRTAQLDFQGTDKKPKRLIEAKQISKAFGNKVLFKDFNLFIGPKDRIGLLGQNGCGKSTLIQILLGNAQPDSGTVIRAENLKPVYFEQTRETLDQTTTLRKAVCPHGDYVTFRGKPVHVHGYLDRFLFKKEQFDMSVSSLSGGEQARVLIAKLMLKEANLLILDEPTNDLDVETLDVLQDCLEDFDGAVLLVTHDRYFLDQVTTQICAFPSAGNNSGKIIDFAGLDQWESWLKERESTKDAEKKSEKAERVQNRKRKLSFNETRELDGMEKKIQDSESKLESLRTESGSPEAMKNQKRLHELYQSMAQAEQEIEKLYARWAELEALKE